MIYFKSKCGYLLVDDHKMRCIDALNFIDDRTIYSHDILIWTILWFYF